MDKTRKKKLRQYIAWGCLGLLVALLAAMPLLAGNGAKPDGPVATVRSGTVDRGTVVTTLGGGGNLVGETPEEITLPEGIRLTEFLVEEGQAVREGEPLASVDRVSVMAVIAEVQETMDYLAEEIADAAGGRDTAQLKAQAAGRVKAVYARCGDDVQTVMLEHGALAVLSLDNRMAVDLQLDADLAAGDSVSLVLSDGTEVTGRVESSLGSKLTVTLEDKGYPIGEPVTVKLPEGETLGSGELYVHNAWNVTAGFGTVDRVDIKENDKVTAGKVLFRLKNAGNATQVQLLNTERQKYEELMERLFKLYDTGCLTAPCDGYVSGVDADSAWLLAAAEQQWQVQWLRSEGEETSGWGVMLLSGEVPADPPGEVPEGGETPAPGVTFHVISAVQVDAAVGENLYKVRRKDIDAVVADLSILNITVPKDAPTEELTLTGAVTPEGQPHVIQTGDILLYVEQNGLYTWICLPGALSGLPGNMGGIGNFGNMDGFFFGGTQQETFEKFDLTETAVLTVTPGNTMTLEITVDELDVGRIRPGQEAEVTVHALGEKVTGTVSRIGGASNSGGNSKFTVTVTLPRGDSFLGGMSASVRLELGRAEDVLRIPVAAVNDDGSIAFVYTGWNETEDVLAAPVAVTLGASDGTYVQILSGLEEGDRFFYSYYDAPEDNG